jgi:hypothetical protein
MDVDGVGGRGEGREEGNRLSEQVRLEPLH